ncbi:MAG: calcium/sodium antiporter [Sphaerochaetaceae bacterium]|nr:calcium/sodium antiporter [Sphaerochaetaceae bacterium]
MIDELMLDLISKIPLGIPGMVILLGIIVICLITLGKGADMLVDEAVSLSYRWGVPKMLIGATIVSLGTTLPEVTVSVVSALQGSPDLAMGNAVGSIICDTGLILGVAALINPLPFKKEVVNRQSWLQFAAGMLLVLTAFIFGRGFNSFSNGGSIPQYMGWIFLAILVVYIYNTIRQAKKGNVEENTENLEVDESSTVLIFIKLFIGIALVILSSKVLIPTVQETAVRLHIPETIIAATLVAFGTSLPELITAVTATRKGYGDLAIGNVLGADILNVLFVVGAAASVTKGGLRVDVHFFKLLFPAMLFVLIVCKLAIEFSKEKLNRVVGAILLSAYLLVTILSYSVAI